MTPRFTTSIRQRVAVGLPARLVLSLVRTGFDRVPGPAQHCGFWAFIQRFGRPTTNLRPMHRNDELGARVGACGSCVRPAPGTALDAVRVDAEFLHTDTRRHAASESQDPVPVADTGSAAAGDAAKQDHVRGRDAHADKLAPSAEKGGVGLPHAYFT